MATNTVVITSAITCGDQVDIYGTVNGTPVYVRVPFSQLNAFPTLAAQQQYAAGLLNNAAAVPTIPTPIQITGSVLVAAVTPS